MTNQKKKEITIKVKNIKSYKEKEITLTEGELVLINGYQLGRVIKIFDNAYDNYKSAKIKHLHDSLEPLCSSDEETNVNNTLEKAYIIEKIPNKKVCDKILEKRKWNTFGIQKNIYITDKSKFKTPTEFREKIIEFIHKNGGIVK